MTVRETILSPKSHYDDNKSLCDDIDSAIKEVLAKHGLETLKEKIMTMPGSAFIPRHCTLTLLLPLFPLGKLDSEIAKHIPSKE